MNDGWIRSALETSDSGASAPHAAVTPELVREVTERVYKLLLTEIKRDRERLARLPGDGGAPARGCTR
jgi:hypothetical protein